MKLNRYVAATALVLSSIVTQAQWSLTGNASTNPSTNFLGTTDAQPLLFKTNGAEVMRVHTNGNVALGTDVNPGGRLAIKGGALPTSVSNNSALNLFTGGPGRLITNADESGAATAVITTFLDASNIELSAGSSANYVSGITINARSAGTTIGPGTIRLWTMSAERMRIALNGNVGIGNSNPAGKLDVTGVAIITNPAGNNYDENLRLPAATSGTASIALGAVAGASGTGVGQWTMLKYPAGGNDHRFAIRYNATDVMTILTGGNMGVGTVTPTTRLHVYATPATAGGDGLKVTSNNASSAYADLVVTGPTYSWMGVGANQVWLHTANGDQNIGTSTAHNVKFIANGAERMRINTSGNVGIGLTNPAHMLTVNGNIGLSSGGGKIIGIPSGYVQLMTGTDVSTDPAITLYGSTNTNSKLITIDGAQIRFRPMDGTELMRLSPAGVAIGTTCVPSGYKVAVKGNIICEKLKVKPEGGNCWADYVFAPDYSLLKLNEVEAFIQKNKHLPGVPSASEVDQNGVEMVEMDATLLKKIEELTLYMIEQNKRLEKLEQENAELQKLVKQD